MSKSLAATKHFQLARTLREELRQRPPGEPVLTVKELKSRFNVSQATVTRALDRLKSEGLIHRPAGRLRFQIADNSSRALHRVAIIRPTWPSPDYDAVVRSLITLGEERGWAFEVFANQSDMEDLDLNRAIGSNDAGVLISGSDRMPEHLLRALQRPRKPMVVVREVPRDLPVDTVSIDDESVGRLATEHLLAHGHRRIMAVISEPPCRSNVERIAGWRSAMKAAGQGRHTESLLFECPVRPTQDSIRMTYETFGHHLKKTGVNFDAIFSANWTGALAVARALREVCGKEIPQDVSLASFAGESLLLPYLNPPMTAVEIQTGHLAGETLRLLERRLDEPSVEAEHVRISPQVVERQSVVFRK